MAYNVSQNNVTVLRPLTQTLAAGAKLLSEAFVTLALHASIVILRVMRPLLCGRRIEMLIN